MVEVGTYGTINKKKTSWIRYKKNLDLVCNSGFQKSKATFFFPGEWACLLTMQKHSHFFKGKVKDDNVLVCWFCF